MTYWVRQSVVNSSAFSTSLTVVSENNFQFMLTDLNSITNYTSVFDQYCIYSVSATFTFAGLNPNSGAYTQSVPFFSAIDYDNVTNTGLAGLDQFSTFNESQITPSSSVVRYVKPCVALAAYTGTFNGFTTTRLWLDCNSTSVAHYGLRTICGPTSVVINITAAFSYVLGFRNAHG
jgi:hypothetical protein